MLLLEGKFEDGDTVKVDAEEDRAELRKGEGGRRNGPGRLTSRRPFPARHWG
jgi:hypothetical protein